MTNEFFKAERGGGQSDRCTKYDDLRIRYRYPFTDTERVRLEVYRAAVVAGFYTDWPVVVAYE